MKKIILPFFFSILFLMSSAFSDSNQFVTYKVFFYGIQSENKGLSKSGCKALFHPFTFQNDGKKDIFNPKDNPHYSEHVIVANLNLKKHQSLQVVKVRTQFDYQKKHYDFITHLSSLVYANPFFIKGVAMNQYCKSAYLVVKEGDAVINPKSTT